MNGRIKILQVALTRRRYANEQRQRDDPRQVGVEPDQRQSRHLSLLQNRRVQHEDGKVRLSCLTIGQLQADPDAVDPDLLVDTVNSLENQGIIDRESGAFAIRIESLPVPLCALYFDQKHRHHISDMAGHLSRLLGVGQTGDPEMEVDEE
jgi:hypothetical protein